MDNKNGYSRMTLDGCGRFIKYAIFVVNFIIFLGGLTILGLGAWTLADKNDVSKVMGDNTYVASAAILLAFGGVVSFISFLGCCGAIKEVKCLLMTFFIILLIITILIIVGVVLAYKMKDEVGEALKKGLKETMKEEKSKEAWNDIQKNLKCCGVDNVADWDGVPPSGCYCSDSDKFLCDGPFWREGCATKIQEIIKEHATPLLGVGIAIIVVIILAMIFSCSLFLML